jgi:hypothetical protein
MFSLIAIEAARAAHNASLAAESVNCDELNYLSEPADAPMNRASRAAFEAAYAAMGYDINAPQTVSNFDTGVSDGEMDAVKRNLAIYQYFYNTVLPSILA